MLSLKSNCALVPLSSLEPKIVQLVSYLHKANKLDYGSILTICDTVILSCQDYSLRV